MIEKLGIALQWVLIKIKVLKSDGTRYSSGRYKTGGLRKQNPLTWVWFLIMAVIIIIGGAIYGVIDAVNNLKSSDIFED